ncbi:MAG: tetratricopeptide (TPR) repeat protein [Myxococcota bacterium]|jgi:tetratricopeptide (TPR) repeat protein
MRQGEPHLKVTTDMAEERLEAALAGLLARGATGELDVRDDRKRWIFYLEQGQLVLTRSNLKSEGGEALKAAHPDADRSSLVRIQAATRLRNAMSAVGVRWTFEEGKASNKQMSIPTAAAFIDALTDALSVDQLREHADALVAGWPTRSESARADLPGDEALEAYLNDLDGQRSGEEVLSFAPGGLARGLAGMWLAEQLGWLTAGSPPKAPSSSAGLDLGFDLDALIAAETATTDEPPASPEPTRARTPEPEPEPEPEPAGPGPHPMADRLAELTDRIRAAEHHFAELGLPWDAPAEEFSTAYRQLARDLHPDRYVDAEPELQDLATEVFDKIRAAWEVIGNTEARQKYTDKVIHGKKTEEELAMEQLEAYWSAEANFKKGVAAFNQGQLRQAHEFLTGAVEVVPEELEFRAYHAYTSFAMERTTDPERAMEHIDTLKNVIERNQEQERKLDMAWVLLGRAYREIGEPDKAKRCVVQALRINPSNPDATREMKRLATQKKQNEKKGFFARLFNRK